MGEVLSQKSLRAIERGIRDGRCLTLIPDGKGGAHVVDSDLFLNLEESEAMLEGIAQPLPGTWLEQFIWQFEDGSVKVFAGKVGYHPNTVSTMKGRRRPLSARLFRRMAEAYRLDAAAREFWAKGLLGL